MARSVYATASSAPVCGHVGTTGPDRKEKPVKTKTRTTPMGGVVRLPSRPLRAIVDRTIDAQVANDDQRRKLANGCPRAVDSIDEHLDEIDRELARPTPRAAVVRLHLDGIRRLVVEIVMSNRVERQLEAAIAGDADDMARVARAVESGYQPGHRTRPKLAAAIRRALDPILAVERGELVDARVLVDANRALREVIATEPRARLLSPGVTNEIGREKTRRLARAIYDLT